MGGVCVYIGYDGKWNDQYKYVEFKTHIILVDDAITLDSFKLEICNKLRMDHEGDGPDIWFDTKTDGQKGMLLHCNEDLKVCIHMVKTIPEYHKAHFNIEERIVSQSMSSIILPVSQALEEGSCLFPPTVTHTKRTDRRSKIIPHVEILKENASPEDIKVNSIFQSKEKLRKCMVDLAIERHFEFLVRRSSRQRIELYCKVETCSWRISARQVRNTSLFKIKNYNNNHQCSLEVSTYEQRHADARYVCDFIKDKVRNSKSRIKPFEVMYDLQMARGVRVSYKVARNGLKLATDSIHGTPEDHYMLLSSYLYIMEQRNAGTITNIKWGKGERFKYAFFSYGASVRGWSYCRPVIVIDATFLTAKYRGVLMVAVSKDGNNNTFPLAFGIADSENNKSWKWFIEHLKKALGDREGLVILSDRHQSIAAAVSAVYPNCLHGICVFHLEQNLKAKYRNSTAITLFNSAARAYSREDFNYCMSEIEKLDAGIVSYLMEEPLERWTRSHSTYHRYNMMTTNIVESMNAVLKDARDYPILCLIDKIQCKLQK